jgi:hypothetical protein
MSLISRRPIWTNDMAPQTQRIDTDPEEATWRELERQLAEPAAFDRLLQQEDEMERHPAAAHGTGLRSCVGEGTGTCESRLLRDSRSHRRHEQQDRHRP